MSRTLDMDAHMFPEQEAADAAARAARLAVYVAEEKAAMQPARALFGLAPIPPPAPPPPPPPPPPTAAEVDAATAAADAAIATRLANMFNAAPPKETHT
ncbi:MAG: hypothetical protein ACLQVI_00630 [Polyangiaceae bacterium]